MSNETVIEISSVPKFLAAHPEAALKAIREQGLTKAEVLAQ
jgi:glycine betaine/proline transport system ATP-binding protein